MSSPAVSIVMPAYNHERFVGRSVESVLNQSMTDLELVVIDDGSTDDTAGVIKAFDDPRLHYHWQENQDAFNALNAGLAKCRGKWIAIINSDDIFTPNRLERLLAYQQQSGASFLFSDVQPIDDSDAEIPDAHPWNDWHQGNRAFYFQDRDLYRGFLHGNFMVTTSNIFMSKPLMEKTGGFAPIRYLHDYDYVFRLLIASGGNACYVDDEKLVKYRIHSGNTLSEAAITGREQDIDVIRRYLMEKIPESCRRYAEAGIDRLIALEHELIDVRRQLARQNAPPVPAQPKSGIVGRYTRALARRLRTLFY